MMATLLQFAEDIMIRLSRYIVILFMLHLFVGIAVSAEIPKSWSPELRASTDRLLESCFDSPKLMGMTEKMVQAHFEEKDIIKVQKFIQESIDEGMAGNPLMLKVQEGVAKKIEPSQILKAMEKTRSRYQEANRLALKISDEASIKIVTKLIAESLTAGLVAEDLPQFLEALQNRHTLDHQIQSRRKLNYESLKLVRDMARRGVESGLATHVVTDLLKKNVTADELSRLTVAFNDQSDRFVINEKARLCLKSIQQEYSVDQVIGMMQQKHSPSGNSESSVGGGLESGSHQGGTGNQSGGSSTGGSEAGKSSGGTGSSSSNGSSGSSGSTGNTGGAGNNGGNGQQGAGNSSGNQKGGAGKK
jgi:hypothetical protein